MPETNGMYDFYVKETVGMDEVCLKFDGVIYDLGLERGKELMAVDPEQYLEAPRELAVALSTMSQQLNVSWKLSFFRPSQGGTRGDSSTHVSRIYVLAEAATLPARLQRRPRLRSRVAEARQRLPARTQRTSLVRPGRRLSGLQFRFRAIPTPKSRGLISNFQSVN